MQGAEKIISILFVNEMPVSWPAFSIFIERYNVSLMKYLLDGQETERLTFRLLEEADFDAWLPLFYTDAGRFLGLEHLHTPVEQCKAWFDRCFKRYAEDEGGMNVLIDKATGQMVGQVGLLVQYPNEERVLEVGYSLLPAYRNKGYATEAAMKCKEYAFENKLADFLVSIIHVENTDSMLVAERNGMKQWKATNFKGMPVYIYRIDITPL